MANAALLPIECLEARLRKQFPDVSIELDRPRSQSGSWFLDISRGGHPVIVQWKDGAGFGVSCSPTHAYGEGPDEVYRDEDATFHRVASLLLSGTFTSPPEPVRLSALRRERGMSQAEVAELLSKKQGEVSKIERRKDVKLSTLRDYVASIGGKLEVSARLPGGMVRSIEIEERPRKTARRTG